MSIKLGEKRVLTTGKFMNKFYSDRRSRMS